MSGTQGHRRRGGVKKVGYRARGGKYFDELGAPPEKGRESKRKRGITNEQAKLLGKLCRWHGEPYNGYGMTYEEAEAAIARLQGRRS